MSFDHLIVTEGEFNSLQLQSLTRRYGGATEQELRYVYCVSVGGVNNADYITIQRLSNDPLFWCDNDENGQGEYLFKNAQALMSSDVLITPDCSDADEFIQQFDNPVTAWTKVRQLIVERKKYYRNYEGAYSQVFGVRAGKGKEFQKTHEVAQIIRDDLQDRGAFFNDGILPYVFLKDERKLIEIQPDPNLKILLSRYGINASESLFRYVFEHMVVEALEKGTRTQIHRLAYFDGDSFTLYLNNFNNRHSDWFDRSIDWLGLANDGRRVSLRSR